MKADRNPVVAPGAARRSDPAPGAPRVAASTFSNGSSGGPQALHASTWKPIVLGILLLAIAVRGPGDTMSVATTSAIFAVAAIGLTVLAGPTRIINLGAACFIGTGAFTTAYVNNVYGANFLLSLLVSMLACFVLGWVVAPIASRLAGVYIAIITVGLAFLAQYVFRIATPWTGGTSGALLTRIPLFGTDLTASTRIGGYVIDRTLVYYLICAAILLVVVVVTTRLLDSRIGRALHVVGTSSITARSFGVSPARYRGTALVFSTVLCGLAGGLLAGQQSFVSWDQFDLGMCVDLVAVVVLGGLGSVYGAVVSSAILYTLPELVERFSGPLPLVSVGATGSGLSPDQLTAVIYGASLIVVMVLEPRGLAALAGRVSDRLRHRAAPLRKEDTQ